MQLFINALIAGSLGALIAGGLAFVYGVLGVFNMALGQIVVSSGLITWWLQQGVGLPLPISVIGGLLSGCLITWFTFEVFVEPFFRRHRFLPLVTTIAWSMILDGLLLLLFSARPRSILPGIKPAVELIGARINTVQVILILVTIFLLCSVAYVLHSTPFGRKIRAVVQQPFAAQSLGIPAGLLNRVLFISSGLLAAAGGIFIGIDQNLTPTLAFPLTIKAYAAVIAGGKGHIWGAILAAYVIALLEQLVVGVHWFGMFYIPAGFQSTVALFCIIGFLLWRPQGLFGSSQRTA